MEFNPTSLKTSTWIMLFLVFLLAVCSSFLLIFLFEYPLFEKMDWIKLLLLSVSITLPVIFINSLMVGHISSSDSDNKLKPEGHFAVGSLITFPVIYIPIFIKFFWAINIRTGAIIGLSIEIAIIISSIIYLYFLYKKRNKK